nr:MAG TPA: hypothetical protein [Caudoviricetes sp.]
MIIFNTKFLCIVKFEFLRRNKLTFYKNRYSKDENKELNNNKDQSIQSLSFIKALIGVQKQ